MHSQHGILCIVPPSVCYAVLFAAYFNADVRFSLLCKADADQFLQDDHNIIFLSFLLQYIAFHTKNFVRSVIVVVVSFGLIYACRDFLIQFIIDIIGSDRVSSRLLGLSSQGNQTGDLESFDARIELWLVSIRTWLSSPLSFLFGIGDRLLIEGKSAAVTGIGRHSDVFDTLARYGIIGGILVFSVFFNLYKYLKSILVGNNNYLISYFIIVVAMALTKSILYPEVGFAIFCMLPLCIKTYNYQ